MNDDNCITGFVGIKSFSKKLLLFFKEHFEYDTFKYEKIDLYEYPVTDVSFQDQCRSSYLPMLREKIEFCWGFFYCIFVFNIFYYILF